MYMNIQLIWTLSIILISTISCTLLPCLLTCSSSPVPLSLPDSSEVQILFFMMFDLTKVFSQAAFLIYATWECHYEYTGCGHMRCGNLAELGSCSWKCETFTKTKVCCCCSSLMLLILKRDYVLMGWPWDSLCFRCPLVGKRNYKQINSDSFECIRGLIHHLLLSWKLHKHRVAALGSHYKSIHSYSYSVAAKHTDHSRYPA